MSRAECQIALIITNSLVLFAQLILLRSRWYCGSGWASPTSEPIHLQRSVIRPNYGLTKGMENYMACWPHHPSAKDFVLRHAFAPSPRGQYKLAGLRRHDYSQTAQTRRLMDTVLNRRRRGFFIEVNEIAFT